MKLGLALRSWFANAFAVAGITLLTVVLVLLATSANHKLAIVGIAVSFGLLALAYLGADRAGFGLLCIGFATAALSKGSLVTPFGPSLTLSDLALVGGLALLTPRIARGRNRVSAAFAVGVLLTLITGALSSSIMDPNPSGGLKTLVGWMWCMALLPLAIAAINPSDRMIRTLAWSFVAGHMVSVADALLTSPLSTRQLGLTGHPNEYAESGLLAIALALYLLRGTRHRKLLLIAVAASLSSIYFSGSRGALIALGVVLLIVPLVERTAMVGTLFLMGAALAAALFPTASHSAGSDSALGRLLGNGAASGSDSARTEGLSYGLGRFWQHPITGSGLSNIGTIHVNLLEIAVGCGVIGLVGFLLVLSALVRPLFGSSPHRRLAYSAVAFIAFSATAPALADRAPWLAISLGFVYFRGFRSEQRLRSERAATPGQGIASPVYASLEGGGRRRGAEQDLLEPIAKTL